MFLVSYPEENTGRGRPHSKAINMLYDVRKEFLEWLPNKNKKVLDAIPCNFVWIKCVRILIIESSSRPTYRNELLPSAG